MTFDGLNAKYLRVELGCSCSAESLARSWHEGRVAPDEVLEVDGRRLTFRQACSENPWLGEAVGPLPDKDFARGRSWREERRFRRDLWRRIVDDGDYHGFDSFYNRLDEKDKQITEMTVRVSRAEVARNAAVEEAAHVRAIAEADVKRAERNAADALEAETVAKREAADAIAARIAAEEEMRKSQAQKAAAYAARRKAEHALAVHAKNDAALRDKVSSIVKNYLVPDGRIKANWVEGEIPKSTLSKAIFSFAMRFAPSDVIALYVGDFWQDGTAGIAVTTAGIVSSGSGLATDGPVFVPWGWEHPLVVKGNFLTGASVWMGQILVVNFSSYFLNRNSLPRFVKGLDSANALLI